MIRHQPLGRGRHSRARKAVALAAITAGLALAASVLGCGSSSGPAVQAPTIGAARTYRVAAFVPAAPVRAGVPTKVAFTIEQPTGRPLTAYRSGSGPHTGVHLIIVREDLSTIIHRHPPVAADGMVSDSVRFTAPGRYRVLIDAYPELPGGQPNFQLFQSIRVTGAYRPRPLPAFRPAVSAGGVRFVMRDSPRLRALTPVFLTLSVTDARGHPASLLPWYGALAHAIFFRAGSLDYFHTHVCGAAAANCTSTLGTAKVAGSSTMRGRLTVGVLLPIAGAWELFLQCKVGGRVVTAPFTLHVA